MLKMRRTRLAVLGGIVVMLSNLALITPSSAATEGDLGAVSSGKISIAVSVAPKLKVLSLQGSFPLERGELSLHDGCIASNMRNTSYGVSAHQRSGMLRLAWSDGRGTSRELPANTTVEGFSSAPSTANCNGGLRIALSNVIETSPPADVVTVLLVPM